MAWLGTYAYRKKIYIDNTNIDSDLDHFPITVVLGTSVGKDNQDVSDIFDEIGSEYLKLAITSYDGTIQLYCDVELWDSTNGKAVIHVGLSNFTVFSGIQTEFYIYFDSTQTDNTTYIGLSGSTVAQSVWDSAFKAVYHMNQDPSGGAGAVFDSTDNDNNGTSAGSMLTEDLVDGDVGKAIDFDGNNDLINCQSGSSLDDLATMTLEIFTKITAQTGANATSDFLNKGSWSTSIDDTNNRDLFSASFSDTEGVWSFPQIATGTYKHLGITFDNQDGSYGFTTEDPCSGKTGLELDDCQTEYAWWYSGHDPCYGLIGLDKEDCEQEWAWWYADQTPWDYYNLTGLEKEESKALWWWVHEKSREAPTVYVNGVVQTVTDVTGPVGDYVSDAANGLIIANNAAQNSGLNADVGEVRISGILRSAAWLKATSYSLSDELLIFSATFEPTETSDGCVTFDESNPYDLASNPADPYDIYKTVLYSTGINTDGQLVLGNNNDKIIFTDTEIESIDSISVGSKFTAVIKSDKSLWLAGEGIYIPGGVDSNVLVQEISGSSWSVIDCNEKHSLAIKTNGSLRSQGYSGDGATGINSSSFATDYTSCLVDQAYDLPDDDPDLTDADWAAFYAAIESSCYSCGATLHSAGTYVGYIGGVSAQLRANNAVDAIKFGSNPGYYFSGGNYYDDDGVMYNVESYYSLVDTTWHFFYAFYSSDPTPFNQEVSLVAAGADHSMVATADGKTWSTGKNTYGACANGKGTVFYFYETTSTISPTALACGYQFSAAIGSDGKIYTTGYNNEGQLGLGDNNNRSEWTVIGDDTFISIACSYSALWAIKSDGTLWATGLNTSGELGLGDTNNRNELTQVGSASNWTKVVSYYAHTLVLNSLGDLYGVGVNGFGELGLGDTTNKTALTKVDVSDVSLLAIGYNHSTMVAATTVNPIFDPSDPFGDCNDVCATFGSNANVRTIIIDCADSYDSSGYLGLRGIDLYFQGVLLTDIIDAYATTHYDASRLPVFAFDGVVTGYDGWHTWLSDSDVITNQRILGFFDEAKIADSVIINNYHSEGAETSWGAKNIKIYVTENLYTDTTYGATITNGKLIYDGVLARHIDSDIADPQTFNFPDYDPFA